MAQATELHIYPRHDGSEGFPELLPAMWQTGAPLGDPEAFRAMWQDDDGDVHGAFIGSVWEAVTVMGPALGPEVRPVHHEEA